MKAGSYTVSLVPMGPVGQLAFNHYGCVLCSTFLEFQCISKTYDQQNQCTLYTGFKVVILIYAVYYKVYYYLVVMVCFSSYFLNLFFSITGRIRL